MSDCSDFLLPEDNRSAEKLQCGLCCGLRWLDILKNNAGGDTKLFADCADGLSRNAAELGMVILVAAYEKRYRGEHFGS